MMGKRMTRKRWKEQRTCPCFGEYLCDRAGPAMHHMRQLEALIEREVSSERLGTSHQAKSAGAGRSS